MGELCVAKFLSSGGEKEKQRCGCYWLWEQNYWSGCVRLALVCQFSGCFRTGKLDVVREVCLWCTSEWNTRANTKAHTHACKHTHWRTHTCMPSLTRTCSHTHQNGIQGITHMRTHTHTHTHQNGIQGLNTHTHTHTHTHMRTHACHISAGSYVAETVSSLSICSNVLLCECS